jgi:hypothetical protein
MDRIRELAPFFALFWISVLLITAIAVIPVIRFLLYQWDLRMQEFVNRFRGKALEAYLSRFHETQTSEVAGGGQIVSDQAAQLKVFEKIYRHLTGRHLYIAPLILLMVTIFVFGGLAIETAVRTGYEQYFIFYQNVMQQEGAPGSKINLLKTELNEDLTHPPIRMLDVVVFPFPKLVLDLQSFAAIAGAYLYVVGVLIQGYRARTLLNSDLLWCSFRMVIAVPLGLSLSAVASPALGAFVAFGLGAFPMEAITRILRRLVNKTLNQSVEETSDALISLVGVTPDVSALLNGEGINAIQQIASLDPVALAVRTGLPFDYVLNLSAQSQAWCYLGSTVSKLAPLGLGDARALAQLSQRLDLAPPAEEAEAAAAPPGEADAILNSACTAAKLDPPVLRSAIRRIAKDTYTRFLLQFSD